MGGVEDHKKRVPVVSHVGLSVAITVPRKHDARDHCYSTGPHFKAHFRAHDGGKHDCCAEHGRLHGRVGHVRSRTKGMLCEGVIHCVFSDVFKLAI